MTRLFILIKRKGAKSFRDAIPARKGISKSNLQKKVRKSLRAGLTFRIITESQFKNILLRQAKKTKRGTKVKKRGRRMKKRSKRRKRK